MELIERATRLLKWIVSFGLISTSLANGIQPAHRSENRLKTLYQSRNWLALREAVKPNSPPLYRGAVACAFNHASAADNILSSILRSAPDSYEAAEARTLLFYQYLRLGSFSRAFKRMEEMRAKSPGDSGAPDPFFSALSEYPDLSVERRKPSTLRYLWDKDLFLPVTIGSKSANFLIDSGADFSMMSESEARRLGLTIRDLKGSNVTDGASGKKVETRLAMAESLAIGGVRLSHILFMVIGDDAMPFVELPEGRRGILGLPVLLALKTLRWEDSGKIEIGFPSPRKMAPDMSLDSGNLMVEGAYRRHKIAMLLDTGNGETKLTPRFARDFPDAMKAAKKGAATLRGVGGATKVDVRTLPKAELDINGFTAILKGAKALPEDKAADRSGFHVWLGSDLLRQARRVTLDFETMTLTLE